MKGSFSTTCAYIESLKFSKFGKNKKFSQQKNIKLMNGGVLIREGRSDFFSKKIKRGGDVYSGPKSIEVLLLELIRKTDRT